MRAGIDTITAKIRVSIPDSMLTRGWGFSFERPPEELEDETCDRKSSEISGKIWFKHRIPTQAGSIYLTYYPECFRGYPLLMVHIPSLPKVVFGNNYTTLTDVYPATKAVNELLRDAAVTPDFDINDAVLYRIDFCFNYQLGADLDSYLAAMSGLNYPYRHRVTYSNRPPKFLREKGVLRINGVEFPSDSDRTIFYKKLDQCHDPAAEGMLRHERSIRTTRMIENRLDMVAPTVRDITPDLCTLLLDDDLCKLGLHNPIIQKEDLFEHLCSRMEPKRARKIHRMMLVFNEFPSLTLVQRAEKFGVSVATIYRWRDSIAEAGIAPIFTTGTKELPPLTGFFNRDSQI